LGGSSHDPGLQSVKLHKSYFLKIDHFILQKQFYRRFLVGNIRKIYKINGKKKSIIYKILKKTHKVQYEDSLGRLSKFYLIKFFLFIKEQNTNSIEFYEKNNCIFCRQLRMPDFFFVLNFDN